MANEITHNSATGLTFYFCCFQQNGNVFLTGGASDEVWGTGGRTAADYGEAMTEEAGSGHYKGSMAAGVGAGVYQICVYHQLGGGYADADPPVSQGEIYWDGSAEVNQYTISETDIAAIITKLPTNYIMGSSDQADHDISVDDIHDEVVEGTTTFRQAIKLFLSILTGKSSGGNTSQITFRDIGDTKDRLVATVDSNGNRTSIDTRDGT